MSELCEQPAETIARACLPPLTFGRGLLAEASRAWGAYVVLTMPAPWAAARPLLERAPRHVQMVESMERAMAAAVEASLPQVETIVGLGGGMSLDMAKYVAWQRGVEPVLVPGIASVDACVTNTIAVRDEGRVRHVGFVVPQAVLADFDLMQSAPAHLNRAGIGDILSIHTALWDWQAATARGACTYDDDVAGWARALVDELEARAGAVREAGEGALQWLIESYAAENALCLQIGHARPEEGSEHFLAYNVERRTSRAYVHGELVCLGVLLMARLQGNEPERVERILAASGVRYQPRELGLSQAELEAALTTLPAYVAEEGLPYSVVNARPRDRAGARALCAGLRFP